MDYVPTDWVEHETLVDAARMNKIEAGVDTAHDEAHAAQVDADAALADAATAQQTADDAQAAADAAAAGAIPRALLDAKGDLLAASAADTPARLPLGADGQILTADAAQALGVKWAAPAPSGADLSYDGDYAPATEYADGDIVVKDGIAYLCVGGPTTVAPDPAPWGAAALSLPAYGTALPASPQDGQEAILVDSLTAPTYQWRFRYNAGSSSPYKWEFIGGSPYFATAGVGAAETIGPSGAWADLATVGPRMLVPRAGIYEGNAIVQCTAGGATRRVIQISLWDGTTGTSGLATATSTDAQDDYRTFSVQDVLTIPAGSDIRVRYWGSAGDQFFNRSLRVIPVRVA